ncbi:Hsp70 family protein [Amycolatopsis sp. NPDC049252]|uniref:Hsp70 family protein n=1 Tax=Amycolatopsis sp. NPDC049252 TaxID=3363933 RepID=UPI0037102D9B
MIIGIDLGTTFSAVAVLGADGEPSVLSNGLGESTTPSVVYFDSPGSVLVGTAARDAAAVDPDNGVALVKRRMGEEFELLFHGTAHTPESISALILRSLVEDAKRQTGADAGEEVRAVITVPAYFGVREREATFQAARLAGIEVLELLAEPVAAALHYGVAARPGSTVLVYDLGGGTFDTTVLRIQRDGAQVVATDGDSRLGGADWDERVADFLTQSFAAAEPDSDPYDEELFLHEVRLIAEVAKKDLSERASRPVSLRLGGRRVTVPFDRSTLTGIGSDLVDRTLAIVDRVLSSAEGKGIRQVHEVVLVGGSTRMPVIAAAVEARLGRTPRLLDPDHAVVRGAAIRAGELAGAGRASRSTRSVVPRSFGVLIDDSHAPSGDRRVVVHTVHRNAPLPAAATTEFCTIVAGQDSVRVQVFEQAGELPSEDPAANRRVLDGELTGLPPLPAGSPIELTLRVSEDGLLRVTAREPRSGTVLELEAYMDGVVDGESTRRLATALGTLTVRQ